MDQTVNGYRLDYAGGAEHYLIVSGEREPILDSELSALELRMLMLHTIPGLAAFRTERQNLQVQLYYRITGKKPLKVWMQAYSPDLPTRARLLLRMVALLGEGTGYLLTAERYLLHRNVIFVGEKPDDLALIYLPLTRPSDAFNGIEALVNLASELLSEHPGFTRSVAAGTGSLSELKRLLQEMFVEPPPSEEAGLREFPSSTADSHGGWSGDSAGNEIANNLARPSVSMGSGSFPYSVWLAPLLSSVRRFWSKPAVALSSARQASLSISKRVDERLPKDTTFLTEPNATVLLDLVAAGSARSTQLEWVEQGERKQFLISSERCMIGRAEEADFRPDVPGVSRSHAELVEGELLADLGSKNGTFLNDERLIPFKRYALASGDRIRISGAEYVYRRFPSA